MHLLAGPQELKSFDELTARDVMSSPAVFATPDAGILEVMEMLVDKGISGLPICSERACSFTCCTGLPSLPYATHISACAGDDGHVLGIVSGYDLLAVDATPGRLDASLDANYLFPPVNLCALTSYSSVCCPRRST